MKPRDLLRVGITGTVLTGICCFTPFLITVFSVFGVVSWLTWTDFVLFPMLGAFLILTITSVRLKIE